MKRFFLWAPALIVAFFLVGCAHPISMTPDFSKIGANASPSIDKTVAYQMSDANRALEVTTPGGGGDKVRYFPYRDMEAGIYKALNSVFRNVTKVQNAKDPAQVQASGATLLLTPEIRTTTYSDSILTWPPTWVTIDLTGTFTDASGQTVKMLTVTGEGRATFDEFKSNLSLAAIRAADDLMAKFVKAMADAPELRK